MKRGKGRRKVFMEFRFDKFLFSSACFNSGAAGERGELLFGSLEGEKFVCGLGFRGFDLYYVYMGSLSDLNGAGSRTHM